MGRFLVRRAGFTVIVLFLVSVITFLLMHAIPGGPFTREKQLPLQVIARLEAKYNLDAPLVQQYIDYMADIIIPRLTAGAAAATFGKGEYLINIRLPLGEHGTYVRWMNFGPSYRGAGARTVNDIIRQNLPVSLQLGLAAMVVAITIGVPLGIFAALRRNTLMDYGSMGVAIVGVSVPAIVLGPVLRYIFGVELRWFPVTWSAEGYSDFARFFLPALALGFSSSALIARLTRASLLQVLDEDYMDTARAKGLPERRVIIIHALRNALIPVVTILGPLFAILLTGTFVIEQIFAIPGLGRYFIVSITNRDYPVIMGTILLFTMFLVVANMLVDITYAWLDPRIRYI